jgi:thiol-disulfide isomerase/thioredoxin
MGCILAAFSVLGAPVKLPVLKVGSKSYKNVTVIGANMTDLYFTHEAGIANVKLRHLEPALQKRFNYDPAAAAELERQQEKEDALYHEAIAVDIMARAEKAATAAKKAAITSDANIADPISDRSLLGKKAPPLEVEKWLGGKPALEGRFVLISVWAPWSLPCRRFIPVLNALQKKFGSRLVVVGLTAEPEADVVQMGEPALEFASAIDRKGRLCSACGITSVPYVLLLDDKHVVRFEGHPGALDAGRIQALMGAPAE